MDKDRLCKDINWGDAIFNPRYPTRSLFQLMADCNTGQATCEFTNDKRKPHKWVVQRETPTQRNCTPTDQTLTLSRSDTITASDNISRSRTNGWNMGISGDSSFKPEGVGVGAALSFGFNKSTTETWQFSTSYAQMKGFMQTAKVLPGHKGWVDMTMPMQYARGDLTVRYIAKVGKRWFLGKDAYYGVKYTVENYAAVGPATLTEKNTDLIPKSAPMTVDELRRACGIPDLAGRSESQAGGGIVSYVTARGPRVELPALEIADGDDETSATAPSKKGLWWMVRNHSPNRKVWIVRVQWGAERCERYDIWARVPNGAKDELTRIDTVASDAHIDTVKLDEPTRAQAVKLRCLDHQKPGSTDGPATIRSFEVYPEL
ncbi:hypothetical protein [Streptomyces sp. NPDC058572]|uniref:hypothetical protein n=1 Tax=Streptomyces sp. NPDC058572 TaxID=3346546 RepID=UPI00365BB61F